MMRVAVSGAGLEVRDVGDGHPLVLVHGSSNDHRMWREPMERWSDDHRVIAYSRRYHWPNAPIAPGGTYALVDHVNDLRELLRTLDVGPATLVGHSYGGLVSLVLAARTPGAVHSLVLVEPPVMGLFTSTPPRPGELLKLALRHPRTAMEIVRIGATGLGPAAKALRRGDDEEGLRLLGTAVLGEEALRAMAPERVDQVRDNLIVEELESPEAFPRLDRDALASLRRPVLLVGGARSPALFRCLLDRLEELLPDTERVTVEGASHLVQEDRPDRFDEALEAFLARREADRTA